MFSNSTPTPDRSDALGTASQVTRSVPPTRHCWDLRTAPCGRPHPRPSALSLDRAAKGLTAHGAHLRSARCPGVKIHPSPGLSPTQPPCRHPSPAVLYLPRGPSPAHIPACSLCASAHCQRLGSPARAGAGPRGHQRRHQRLVDKPPSSPGTAPGSHWHPGLCLGATRVALHLEGEAWRAPPHSSSEGQPPSHSRPPQLGAQQQALCRERRGPWAQGRLLQGRKVLPGGAG